MIQLKKKFTSATETIPHKLKQPQMLKVESERFQPLSKQHWCNGVDFRQDTLKKGLLTWKCVMDSEQKQTNKSNIRHFCLNSQFWSTQTPLRTDSSICGGLKCIANKSNGGWSFAWQQNASQLIRCQRKWLYDVSEHEYCPDLRTDANKQIRLELFSHN